MSVEDISTVDAELVPLAPAFAFLELRLIDEEGERYLPFLSERLEFRLGAQECWVELHKDALILHHRESRPLQLDQNVKLEGGSLRVVDLRTLPPFWLVGLSPQLNRKRWPVEPGECLLGRAGKRLNNVLLNHPSISRAHARIQLVGIKAKFQAESGALSAINGQQVSQGQTLELIPNDVLQLGELHLRWEREERALTDAPGMLRLQGLGMPATWIDGREVRWNNENAQDLLFWLASCQGSTLAVRRVLDEYWPDRATLRQRKNLSHVLKSLQAELGLSKESVEHMVERTPETLRLNPSRVAQCDFWTGTYGGAFLPHNKRPWARSVRREQLLAWLSALISSPPQVAQRQQVLALLTQILRDNQFEDFVYQRACQAANALASPSHAAMWLEELKERESDQSE